MKPITITIKDIKAIKDLMDSVDTLKDNSLVIDGYSSNHGNQELIIEQKESTINRNVHIVANLLNQDFDTVIDMCYDFDFAKTILNN